LFVCFLSPPSYYPFLTLFFFLVLISAIFHSHLLCLLHLSPPPPSTLIPLPNSFCLSILSFLYDSVAPSCHCGCRNAKLHVSSGGHSLCALTAVHTLGLLRNWNQRLTDRHAHLRTEAHPASEALCSSISFRTPNRGRARRKVPLLLSVTNPSEWNCADWLQKECARHTLH
jgi:hypothetical protein